MIQFIFISFYLIQLVCSRQTKYLYLKPEQQVQLDEQGIESGEFKEYTIFLNNSYLDQNNNNHAFFEMINSKDTVDISYEVFYEDHLLIQRCNQSFYQTFQVCIVLNEDINQLQQTYKGTKINNFTSFKVKVNCIKDCIFTFFAYFGNPNNGLTYNYNLLQLGQINQEYPMCLSFNKNSISFDIIQYQNKFDLKDVIIKKNLIIIKQKPKESIYFFFVNKFDRNSYFYIRQDKMMKLQDFIQTEQYQLKIFGFCFLTLGNVIVQLDENNINLRQATYTRLLKDGIIIDNLKMISDDYNQSYITLLESFALGYDVEEYHFFNKNLLLNNLLETSLYFFQQICIEPILDDISITIIAENNVNQEKKVINQEKQISYCYQVQRQEENITQLQIKGTSNSQTVVRIDRLKYFVYLGFEGFRFQLFLYMQGISKFIIVDQIDNYLKIVFTVVHFSNKQNIYDQPSTKQTNLYQTLMQQIVNTSQVKRNGIQNVITVDFDDSLFFQEDYYLSIQLFYYLNDFKLIYFWFSKKKNKFVSTFQISEEKLQNIEFIIEPYQLSPEFELRFSENSISVIQIIEDEQNYKYQELPNASSFILEKSKLRLEDDGKIHLKYQIYCYNQCLNPQILQKNSQNNVLKIVSSQHISQSFSLQDFEFQEYSQLYLLSAFENNIYFYQEHNLLIVEVQADQKMYQRQFLACQNCIQNNLSNKQQIQIISNSNEITLKLGQANILKQNQYYLEDLVYQSSKILYLKNNDQLFLTLLYQFHILEISNLQNFENYQPDNEDYNSLNSQSPTFLFYKNKNRQDLIIYSYGQAQMESLLFTAQSYTVEIDEFSLNTIFEIENKYERYIFFIKQARNQQDNYIFKIDFEQEKYDMSVSDKTSIYFKSSQITIQYFHRFDNLYDLYVTETQRQLKMIKFDLKRLKLISLNLEENIFNEQNWPSQQLLFTLKLEQNQDYIIQLSDEFIQENQSIIGISFYSNILGNQNFYISASNFQSKEDSLAIQSQVLY
ncbi:hypothetical protein ABPG74_013746 [Tetrahymena malaccensis]